MANICEYYPCHKITSDFSCEYCYCPIYKENCEIVGGNPKFIITKMDKVKDCSDCNLPHTSQFRKDYEEKISKIFR